MNNRGVSAAIGKLLAAGIVVLYVAGSVFVLSGEVVPNAREAAGREVAERVLADATLRLERALQPSGGHLEGRIAIPSPATIAGAGYQLALQNRSIHLRHPNPRLSLRADLAIPEAVTPVEGAVDSGAAIAVTVSANSGDRTVRLVETG